MFELRFFQNARQIADMRSYSVKRALGIISGQADAVKHHAQRLLQDFRRLPRRNPKSARQASR